jgi:hypothetical protein
MKTFMKHILAILSLVIVGFAVQAQVKIGSNPTTIEAQSNLEVEASTPNRKVKVDKTSGQVTIQDGTEGIGKVLTSDAVGGASWQSPAAQTTQTWIKATNTTSSTQAVGLSGSPTVLDFISEVADRSNEFNVTTDKATMSTSGLYQVTASARKIVGAAGSWGAALAVRGSVTGNAILSNVDGTDNSADHPLFSGSATVFLNAGEVVDIIVYRGPAAPAFNITDYAVTIVKLSN